MAVQNPNVDVAVESIMNALPTDVRVLAVLLMQIEGTLKRIESLLSKQESATKPAAE